MSQRSILDLEEGETYPEAPAGANNRKIPDKLKTFRDLVGINPILDSSTSARRRPAENEGTYKRLVDAELKARIQYYASASLINICLLAQIVIAAALTALGAASGSHIAITVLGSVNTVIAGGMTYLKGQGLPERLVEYANGLRRVREYLEERERQFSRPDCNLDVDQEARNVLRMYEAVRKSAEDSYSSTWKSSAESKAPKDDTPDRSQVKGGNGKVQDGAHHESDDGGAQGKKPTLPDGQGEASDNTRDQPH
ncbi:hypothetical protein MMC07_009750 [Pseudocyphellaria aurata]|nr:hypothetical protein [Pseudocyphellaria aurata]